MEKVIPDTVYLRVMKPLIDESREILEAGNHLPSVIIVVGVFEEDDMVQIYSNLVNTSTEKAIRASLEKIRKVASERMADFAFIITRAKILSGDHCKQEKELIERFGSIANAPQSEDVVTFILETHAMTCVANQSLRKLRDGLTFDDPDGYIPTNGDLGIYSNLLPATRRVVH